MTRIVTRFDYKFNRQIDWFWHPSLHRNLQYRCQTVECWLLLNESDSCWQSVSLSLRRAQQQQQAVQHSRANCQTLQCLLLCTVQYCTVPSGPSPTGPSSAVNQSTDHSRWITKAVGSRVTLALTQKCWKTTKPSFCQLSLYFYEYFLRMIMCQILLSIWP